jgi:hypothetical protein
VLAILAQMSSIQASGVEIVPYAHHDGRVAVAQAVAASARREEVGREPEPVARAERRIGIDEEAVLARQRVVPSRLPGAAQGWNGED